MRLAHLILAHANPVQLERLVKRLLCSDTDIFIHLDKKSDIKEFLHLQSFKGVIFIAKRVKVAWGDFSMVEATFEGMRQILNYSDRYSHINLLSGQDYPLKDAAEIQNFLFANQEKTFMKYRSVNQDWTEATIRLSRYHLGNYRYPCKYKVQSLLNTILPPKKLPQSLVAFGLSQWLTITPEHAKYVIQYLKGNKSVARFFRMTWGADELIFQTILLNSVWKDHIVNDYLRYIKFPKGASRPSVLTIFDAENLMTSNRLYARKFDTNIDKEILDHIDSLLDEVR